MKLLRFLMTFAIILALSTQVFAYRDNGEYPSDAAGKWSSDFAPNICASVSLGTKGVTNVSAADVTAYKFWFTNTSTGAAVTGIFKPGAITTWADTGTVKTTSDKFTVGKGVKTLGFANNSSATAGTVTYCLQKR